VSRRVAIGVHEITRVLAGEQTLFLRPDSSFFTRVKEGDRLWIAEPFYLEKRFDGIAPTVARDLGAVPAFAADNVYNAQQLSRTHGQRHPARSLCRDWHRAHIVITSRTELRLQDLGDEDIAQLGFANRSAFAAHWDKEAQLVGIVRYKLQHNPRVLRFGFRLVNEPIAFPAKPPAKKRGPKPLTQKSTPPAPVAAVAVAPPPPIVAPPPPPVAPLTPPPVTPAARPIGQQAPLGEIFSTGKGDAAFLAALKRERASGHTDYAAPVRAPVRIRTMPAMRSPTGSCPTCGTRFAHGCKHYPLTEQREAAR
jgi:hypothetical protein